MYADLYSATITSVPFLLLALLTERSLVLGPGPGHQSARSRRLDAAADAILLLLLLVAFISALIGLALPPAPDLRLPAAAGLGAGAPSG